MEQASAIGADIMKLVCRYIDNAVNPLKADNKRLRTRIAELEREQADTGASL
ncbi:hypothetical protein IL54_2559 [Sphingobium sp. ba1]|jgi:hypothetical protein|uniref:hypothetical protein n=1 Tax=Sphingobium sp. ba1 TaxID=1522072 RepID=UPI000505B479|nr:hypothetical protein [Sphingobium sp. ba1]KFL47136.1 hypothetical protein IL54_2559 [Sphingobium sp. ba1]